MSVASLPLAPAAQARYVERTTLEPLDSIPQDHLADELRPELADGEPVIWSGRPLQGLRLRASDWLFVPLSLAWCAIFLPVSDTLSNPQDHLLELLLILAGAYATVGRFFVDAFNRERTLYAVTDVRVIIIAGFPKRTVRSVPIRNLPEITFTESPNRTGTITFGSSPWRNVAPRFELLPDVRRVYERVRAIQRNANQQLDQR